MAMGGGGGGGEGISRGSVILYKVFATLSSLLGIC